MHYQVPPALLLYGIHTDQHSCAKPYTLKLLSLLHTGSCTTSHTKTAAPKAKTVRSHEQDIIKRTAVRNTLIDTSKENFQKSPGLKDWADIQNLKTAAAAYAKAENLTELKKKIENKNEEISDIRSELSSIGRSLKELKEIQYYLNQYKDNAPFMQHEKQLTLYDGAKNKLQEYGIKPHISALRQVDQDIADLEKNELSLEQKYNSARKEAKDLDQKYQNITEYLGLNNEQKSASKERQKENTRNSTLR